MAFRLSPGAERAGYRLAAFETLGSTNVEALERGKAGDPGRLWVVSRRQETGRGRRGRPWATESGNLAATLLVTGERDLAHTAMLGFVAGLSLAAALDAVLPQERPVRVAMDGADGASPTGKPARISLKWPNDVLLGGAKLAGILIETAGLAQGGYAAAVGIGVNVVSHPQDLPYPATDLSSLGLAHDAEDVFLALSDAWLDTVGDWDAPGGLARIRERWLARATGIGGEVAVQLPGEVVRGVFETIDEDCRFVVRQADGTRTRITAGDVHFGAVATKRDDEKETQ
ncbi:biotin--[acetyl-CoA-carboxylase] ligase [Pararhizobium mangrovi]|uniref:biotin--[biotin carboxyl-carrier protein] ligase n=1 Tax=Pararhizobium mangrovi TaxID=2590452 RepID=A0A506UCP2_9HYPH|nr:biotin--[acetyl-CoA-carboxylase] ligase [Pararhizobium mangrovi]TPW30439.1 biotin--[acetyl-CoA-carboxylase] ligase [Pararhizobium mangrovi]